METSIQDQISTEDEKSEKPSDPSVTDETGRAQADMHPNVDVLLQKEVGECSDVNRNAQHKEEADDDLLKDDQEKLLKEDNGTVQDETSEYPQLTPELTLVLFGDADAVEPGPNLLRDPYNKRQQSFASSLYDLFGRTISIIDLLGQKNTDNFPTEKRINAFLLLIPHRHHISKYKSWVRWLKSSFGKKALDYLITVVTQESKETSEGAMIMKDVSHFSVERFQICTKTMMVESEMSCLLEKMDAMVSKNDQHYYCRVKMGTQGAQATGYSAHLLKRTDHRGSVRSQKITEQCGDSDSPSNPLERSAEKCDIKTATELTTNNPRITFVAEDKGENAEENNKMKATVKQEENQTLLRRLNLLGLKLTPAEFLQIGPHLKQDLQIQERDLFSVYLHKLLMLDYRARYVQAKEQCTDEKHSTLTHDNEETDDDDDSFFKSKQHSVAKSQQSNIHPLDIQMAVFHCSDTFLKQMTVTKLSQCQYALPLLVPDPFTEDILCPLWTLRQIKKSWKKTEIKDDSDIATLKSMPICKAETPMVFCFRLGSLSVSKSQLINTLINERHNTFFHRNCPGSTKTRLMFDGVAEIAWYCPAGKQSDTFTDCVAFCNLHGDGLTHDKQLKILMNKSSINVVFVPTLRKDPVISACMKSSKPLIVVIEDSADATEKMKRNRYKVGLKDRSQSDVCKELKNIIKETLSGIDSLFQLEKDASSMVAKGLGIKMDENETSCNKGFAAALEVMKTFDTTDVTRIKKQYLPCQGVFWHKWSEINKEMYRLREDIGLEKEKSEKQKELQQLREDQCKASGSILIKTFIKHLSTLPPTEKEYFLKWTQIFMDAHTTDDLSSILQRYDQTWSKVLDLKKKNDKSNEFKLKQAELEEISKDLQSATCGLEHIFREMGQIYEAHETLKRKLMKNETDWSKFPELAADLMISGHPMELMDGDAGHVPLLWISSVIDQVIHKMGDKRVFVLSVLGIQSSGKSTMLNAMFGLQFAVSAGRCTRGAFMQLVKLSEDIRKDFQWDYILVVDTEGLRAQEMEGNATIHHDNELATFVVGVGNMTLVNIFGENPSEMQDVLQIVVQAFMRMKKVKLSPSCVFVHQNVTDVGAAENNMDQRRKLLDKLDQMVALAAKEEGSDAEDFSDVIEFDVQKDVKYFAQLWEGCPPMAPPNPGYSESVQDLKSFILSKASRSRGVTLSEFKSKVTDLWNALLNENFVFSFRNTLEIAVYRNLEVQYGKWTWSLREEMLRIEERLYTRIENGTLDLIDHSSLQGQIVKKYNEIRKDFIVYFDNDKLKEMLVQWRAPFEMKIKDVCDDLVRGLQRKLTDVIEQKKAGQRLDEMKPQFEKKLLEKSKELARQLKDKDDEDKLQKQFNSVWERWVSELIQGAKPIKNIVIDEEVRKVLGYFYETSVIHDCKTSNRYKVLSKIGDLSLYVAQKGRKQKPSVINKVGGFLADSGWVIKNLFSGHPQAEKQIRDLIIQVEEEALKQIKNKPMATRGYNSTHLYEVAIDIMTRVAEFESKQNYCLKKEFTIDLILFVFDKASKWISQSHNQYIKCTDACTYLESKKGEYYSVFRSFCKGSTSAVVLAEVICKKLEASMTEAVCNRTAIDIANDMRTNHPGFNENRMNLEKHALKSLAEKEDFKSYIDYIYCPVEYIKQFITEKVNGYIQTGKNLFIRKNVDLMETFVIQCLHDATEKIQEGDVDLWLQEFFSLLKEKLTVDSISSMHFKDVNTFDFLREGIKNGLDQVFEGLKKMPLNKLKDFRMQPDQMLIDQLCDCCWETCPFCAAVCTNTVKDHSPDKHCVPYHRPSGIKGWHKTDTVELVIDFCTTLVASERTFRPNFNSDICFPYKEYPTAGGEYAEWQITPSGSMLVYWKWFICRFQRELEDHYKLKFVGRGEIPTDWRKYSKEEAIKSLDEMYNM